MTDQLVHPELAEIEVHGMSRSSFIVKGTLAAGALYGATAVSPFVGRALAATGTGDIGVLNYALTLEYLESAFYADGLRSAHLSGEAKAYAQEFGAQEAEHVSALTQAIKSLHGKPVAAPMVSFPFTNQASFLKLAAVLEDTGVGAYNGAAPMISAKAILAAAGSIVQIEARHAATIRVLINENPAPNAFDKALSQPTVLGAVKPFIK
jgi:hypothetical protein